MLATASATAAATFTVRTLRITAVSSLLGRRVEHRVAGEVGGIDVQDHPGWNLGRVVEDDGVAVAPEVLEELDLHGVLRGRGEVDAGRLHRGVHVRDRELDLPDVGALDGDVDI